MAFSFIVKTTPEEEEPTYIPMDEYSKLLVHFEENPIIDHGPSSYTLTNINVSRNSSIYKFGAYSGNFPGNGYLNTSTSSDWHFTGDFTLECWVYFNGSVSGNNMSFMSYYNTSGSQRSWAFVFRQNRLYFIYSFNGSSAASPFVNWTPSINTWYHLAVTRSGSTVRIFANGVQQGSNITVSGALKNSTAPLRIGAFTDASLEYLIGNMDEVHISNGIARWTTNFTPPALPWG